MVTIRTTEGSAAAGKVLYAGGMVTGKRSAIPGFLAGRDDEQVVLVDPSGAGPPDVDGHPFESKHVEASISLPTQTGKLYLDLSGFDAERLPREYASLATALVCNAPVSMTLIFDGAFWVMEQLPQLLDEMGTSLSCRFSVLCITQAARDALVRDPTGEPVLRRFDEICFFGTPRLDERVVETLRLDRETADSIHSLWHQRPTALQDTVVVAP